jgi:CBS domain-containing protein
LWLAVVEVSSDDTIADTVRLLSEHNIMAAPVRNSEAAENDPWSVRYIGMVDYPAVVLWVIEQAELAAAALAAGSAAAVGVGAGALGALGALVLGMTGPVALAGLATAAVGAGIAGKAAAGKNLHGIRIVVSSVVLAMLNEWRDMFSSTRYDWWCCRRSGY